MKSVKKTLLLPRIFFWKHSEACKERNFWENLFFTAAGVTSKRKMLNRFSLGNILSLEVLRNNILDAISLEIHTFKATECRQYLC